MVVEHTYALGGQAIDIGCLDLGAIATNVGETLKVMVN
jgi:hypothetical protein